MLPANGTATADNNNIACVPFDVVVAPVVTTQSKSLVWNIWATKDNLNRSFARQSVHLLVMKVCGNKMPTRCNRGFYSRSYCLLNMFRAPLCPSSGAQEYYTVVSACGISCCGFKVVGMVWSWGLCVRFAGCCFTPRYNTLELLMIGIVVPETCWASNNIYNKNLCCI